MAQTSVRRWVFESATDPQDITEVDLREDLLNAEGEPLDWVLEFYDGRLRPHRGDADDELLRGPAKKE